MDIKKLMERVAAGFVRTRRNDCGNEGSEAAVAEVALMIAALDGTVLPEEFATYRWIVSRCQASSDAAKAKALERGIGLAGRLLLMAQVGAYDEAERLAAFEETVRVALPNGLSGESSADVRRAFVFWLSMALSDGEYSGVERQAIARLRECLVPADALEPMFFDMAERLLRDLADPERRTEAERALDNLVVFASDTLSQC